MPELLDNTQTQQAISSDQGTNKVAKLDAKSFFFLEDGVFTLQTAAQSFGIIDENQFRTTSIVSVSNKKVFSICKGQIFIQPMTGDATKVNLILKPYIQPINGISIKYFIYRGLSKSNFIEPNGEVKLTGNGLITHIQNEYESFYSNNPPKPEFLARYIGYPDATTTQQDTDLIDSYFYKISQSYDGDAENLVDPTKNFEFPIIPAGTHLATETGSIGLDIVLNYGDYYIANDQNPFKFDLAFARAPFNIINVSGNDYQSKLKRETITQFLDPAAYYGLHANEGGKIFKFGQAQPLVTPQEVASLINNFATKNTIYIYVQSNRQRSYNFYNKYVVSETNANNLKIGLSETTLTETTFETNSWPVKVFTTAPMASSTKQTIAIQFTTDKNPNVSLYGDMAQIGSINQENFVEAKDLIPVPVEGVPETPFTKTVLLHSPIANDNNIASFIQLVYIGKNIILSKPGIDDGDPNTPAPDDILFTTKYMDDVFDLIDATSFLQADKIYHVHSYKPLLYNQGELDKNRKRVIAFTQRTQNTITISDTENLTLFTYLAIVENEQSSHSNFSPTSSSDKTATGYSQQNLSEFHTLPNLPGNEYVELKTFTNKDSQTITGLNLVTNNGTLPTTLVLGISQEENQQILDLVNANNLINPKIYFRDLSEKENNFFTSIENINYKIFALEIVAENIVGEISNNILNVDIIVYSIDNLTFYSKDYSKNIPLLFDNNIILDLNNSI